MSARARRIVFRFDFGAAAGWGHLSRCAALALELRARGWACSAWTNGDLAAMPDDLRRAFDDTISPGAELSGRVEWIVVDHYGYTDAMLRALRRDTRGAPMLVIDDDATRTLDAADVVVNSRLGLASAPYAASRALLGEHYALLRPGLRQPAAIAVRFDAGQQPVLVMLGGTDPRGLTATVLQGMADVDTKQLVPVLVCRRDLPGADAVAETLQRFSASHWIENLDASALAGWAGQCHSAVSACGGALYELAFLGVPFVGVVVADNQRALAREAAMRWRSPIVEVERDDVRSAVAPGLRDLLATPATARTPFGNIDGRGAARVADVIEGRS